MIKELIVTGKTIDQAIESGLLQLSLDRDAVSVEVLETPSKSLFGFKTTDAKVKLSYEVPDPDRAKDFLAAVFEKMGLKADIVSEREGDTLSVTLSGADMGIVIGRRGETLDALQYLTSLVVNKGEKDYIKVTVDTENYRQKREETLARLARKLASKVVKYRRNVTLEPMNPYERRIIHSTLQTFENVSTLSTGVDPNRKIIITYTGSDGPAKDFRKGPRGGKPAESGGGRDAGKRNPPRRDGHQGGPVRESGFTPMDRSTPPHRDGFTPADRSTPPHRDGFTPADRSAPSHSDAGPGRVGDQEFRRPPSPQSGTKSKHQNDRELFNSVFGEKDK